MTLTELWNEPKSMAEFLGWLFEDRQEQCREYGTYGRPLGYMTRTVSAAEDLQNHLGRLRQSLHAEWMKSRHNQFKPMTDTQMIQEALRVEFGIKHGKLHERIALAKMMRPDLYSDDKPAPAPTWEETKKELGIAAA